MSFARITELLFQGFASTCLLFFLTLALALPLGMLFAAASMSKLKPLKLAAAGFIWVIRGTPLLLQIIIVFFMPGLWFGTPVKSRMAAAVVAFTVNYACYFSVIYRGGIENIPKGQFEAGQVLGLTKTQIFTKIILLQIVKRITPPMSNEVITLVKDTALARVIMIVELTNAAQEIIATQSILWPLFYAGVFYLAFNGLLSLLFAALERKMEFIRC